MEDELAGAGLTVERLDLDEIAPQDLRAALKPADVLVVSGGDPFHLLRAARRTGFGAAVREALAAGAVYVGYSAGAMVAGPTLEPLRLTSPITAPHDLDLTGLGLTDVLVLPHHGRPGRAARHAEAQRVYAGRVELVPLNDGELAVQDAGGLTVLRA